MRRGLTLIELIFSMVIIAIVFSVVPKMIFVSNKSLQLTIKEDGMYNAIALLGTIVKLPWDESTIQSGGKIVLVNNECNTTRGYKIGGFVGSRNCIDMTLSPTHGLEGSDYNDVDDCDGYNENATQGRDYNLAVNVTRSDNIKEIKVVVTNNSKKTGNFQTSFFYDSANLGHIQINKRTW